MILKRRVLILGSAAVMVVLLAGLFILSGFPMEGGAWGGRGIDREEVADMDQIRALFETGAGIELPASTRRLCVLFLKQSQRMMMHMRVDVGDASEVQGLDWLKNRVPENEIVTYETGHGPPEMYPVQWWDPEKVKENADEVIYFTPGISWACVVVKRGSAVVFFVHGMDLKDYSPGFLNFIHSYPIRVHHIMPPRHQAFGACWVCPAEEGQTG